MSDDEDNFTEYVTPAPVVEHPAPAPAVHDAPAPVIEYVTHKFVASAPVIEYMATVPVISLLEPPVPLVHVLVPQVQIIEKTVEFLVVQTAQSTRTSESSETVPVCEMKHVVTVEMVEVRVTSPCRARVSVVTWRHPWSTCLL